MRSMRLALVLLTVAVAAPHPLAAQSQPHPDQAPAPGKTATVTGCLARGVAPKTYVLKNVAWQSPNESSPGHAHGSPSAASSTNTPATTETLRLAGAAALGLEPYVGHTISATGALAKADPPVTPGVVLPEPQGDTTSRTRAAEEHAAASLRIFDMRSVTDVAPVCR